MYSYETLSEATRDLAERGYNLDLNIKENRLICHLGNSHNPEDFEIVEFYRFEGDSNPDDLSIVYALESNKGVKGVLVTGYGVSAEGKSAEVMEKIKFREHK